MKDTVISIIGGTDGLGKTIAKFLSEKGLKVNISGPNKKKGLETEKELELQYFKDNIKASELADITIVAVPIHKTCEVIYEISPFLKKGSLLMDLTSIKEGISQFMEENSPDYVEVIPSHPIFGPRVNSLEGQTIVLTPSKKGKWFPIVKEFLEKEDAIIIEAKPKNHDDMMSVVQILTHFSYIATALTITRLSISINESRKFASPNYGLMVDMISRIIAQNPNLTYSIQKENKSGKKIRAAFLDVVYELKEIIENGEEAEYKALIESSTSELGDIESALARSDKVLNGISDEFEDLKNHLGKEIGLKEIYSGEVYSGILKEVDLNEIVLNDEHIDKSFVSLLSDEEFNDWKLNNRKIYSKELEVVLPKNIEIDYILKYLENFNDIKKIAIADSETLNDSIKIKFEIQHISSDITDIKKFFKSFGFKIYE